MNRNFIRYGLIVLLIATLGSTQRTAAQSEQARQITIIQAMAPIGLAFGQSLRINVRNSVKPSSQQDGRRFKMLVAPLIVDLNGSVIAQTDQITLLPNESHTFEFKRDALPLTGEPGTGRLQVVIQRTFTVRNVGNVPDLMELAPFSWEIVDDSTGKTTVGYLGGVSVGSGDLNAPVHNGNFLASCEGMLGVVRDQTLRTSIFNPTARTMSAHVSIFDNSGGLIAQSPELSIPAGEFRFFDLNRDSLLLTGEPGTGRLQMAASIFLKLDRLDPSPLVSMELVDNSNGRTSALLLPAVQVIREARCCRN
jgi:hypothetical protein